VDVSSLAVPSYPPGGTACRPSRPRRGCAPAWTIDAYRQAVAEERPVQRPAPQRDCPRTFGDTSVFAGVYDHPTP